jgi:16S rRNA (uracil1498-N3)-methyltransferase
VTPPVFACPAEAFIGLTVGGQLVLDGAEGHHAVAVRRLRSGEVLDVVDGAGNRARGTVRTAAGDRLELDVTELVLDPAPEPALVVVQALPKGDRGEVAAEMLTEAGVDAVVPWSASRAVTRWEGPRGEKALQRWRSVAREAGKQSRRSRWPDVAPLASTKQVVARLGEAALGVVLHESAELGIATVPLPAAGEIVVVVGPEGGVSDDELAAMTRAGALAVRLGPEVLRTSTAGVAAVAVLSARLGRWS